jgi:hypothetical protein
MFKSFYHSIIRTDRSDLKAFCDILNRLMMSAVYRNISRRIPARGLQVLTLLSLPMVYEY